MLRKPIKNFVQATSLLVLSVVANKFGDLALMWAYVFFLLIPPLIRSRDAILDGSPVKDAELTFSEKHPILAKCIPLLEYLESKIPRF